MKKTIIATLAVALAGCATTGGAQSGGIKSLGGDTYTVSELSGFGSVVERAARFCVNMDQTIHVQGNTTQTGIASGRQYAVLVFRCV